MLVANFNRIINQLRLFEILPDASIVFDVKPILAFIIVQRPVPVDAMTALITHRLRAQRVKLRQTDIVRDKFVNSAFNRVPLAELEEAQLRVVVVVFRILTAQSIDADVMIGVSKIR